ncbi:hypothetical protein D3C86_1421350 [compost metagenome]
MKAIRLHATGNAAVSGNERRRTGLLHDRHDQFGAFLESGVIQTILRNDDGSDIAAPQCFFHFCCLLLRVARFRNDQDKAATIFN